MDTSETAAALEVTYDGRHYHFRQYRYDRLEDALRYATAQRDTPGFRADSAFQPRWLPAWLPSEAERARMAELGIGFAGGRFSVGDYHYDKLDDAVAFASARRGKA